MYCKYTHKSNAHKFKEIISPWALKCKCDKTFKYCFGNETTDAILQNHKYKYYRWHFLIQLNANTNDAKLLF